MLGPLIRFVDDTRRASGSRPATTPALSFAPPDGPGSRTFAVHGHHYALVEVDGLEPGSDHALPVEIDGTAVWPPEDSEYPASVIIATMQPGRPLRMAFGSCRTSVTHDADGNKTHGVDALRAFALRMATDDRSDPRGWPDLVLFLGDQVYADETTPEMREFIESRRDIEQPPGVELKDYEEYAHLYKLAWTDEANRWLLSTLPTAMIFDDHDIRDDWNTSLDWKRRDGVHVVVARADRVGPRVVLGLPAPG